MTFPQKTRKELRSMLIGTLLGDSWITNTGCYGCEQVSLELINIKRNILEQLSGKQYELYERTRTNQVIEGRLVNGRRTFTIQARHPHFKKYRKVLYKNGTKRITKSILKRLSPEAIALWFMDDGYMDYKKSNHTKYMRICTDSYTPEQCNTICDFFQEVYGIQAFVAFHQSNKNSVKKPRVSFNATNSQKLISLIYKFVLPCFYYKLDLHYLPETVESARCSAEYRQAYYFISQNKAHLFSVKI